MANFKKEVTGKRFKRSTTLVPLDLDAVRLMLGSTKPFIEELKEYVTWSKNQLNQRGFDTALSASSFRHKYMKESEKTKKGEPYIRRDSRESDLLDFWQCAEIALNENNPLEARLEHAFKVGDLFRCLKVYDDYGKTQRKIAKASRNNDINQIIKKLSKKTEPAKELWNEFFGDLDNEGFEPKQVSAENAYKYTNIKGVAKEISFRTFANRLSKERKNY